MTAAIYYQEDGYSTAGPKLMGRNAAGESFLAGYFQHATTDRFYVHARDAKAAEPFARTARAMGRNEPIDVIATPATAYLEKPGTLYFPASNIGRSARERSLFGDGGWSICGVTHTTASANAADGIAELLTGAVQPWDAVICTSSAVHANVETVLAAERERLAARFGATRFPQFQLPIIPLGIQTAAFARDETGRADARAGFALDETAVVVLYVGRLSFHAKAHPAAMYAALEAAQARCPDKRVVLIECGWFANDALAASFRQASDALCPSVQVIRVDGRDASVRASAWAAADIFCSLADNIQETFGLTPLEAMAAGLPVVVADWDGYRDTVRDRVDGFRIPTIAPAPGLGGDLAARFALDIDTYDRYCGHSAMFIGVDIAAASDAFAAFIDSPDRRAAMGAAGQARARADYDWRAIIPRYEALWAELGAIRRAAGVRPTSPTPWPTRMDPYRAFASYPTIAVNERTPVALARDGAVDHAAEMRRLGMFDFAAVVLPAAEDVAAMLGACGVEPRPAGEVVAVLPPARRGLGLRGLCWLAKIGAVRISAG